jgi:cation transport regulator ChaC
LSDSKIYVFGYGSLMNRRSIQKTVSREVSRDELQPAVLRDFVRKWDLVEWIKFVDDPSGSIVPAVFLDVASQPGRTVNGILLTLTEQELAKMDGREKNYDRVNVSPLVEPHVSRDVFTYIGKEIHTRPPAGSCVPANYEALVLAGVHEWGPVFEAQYHQSTLPQDFPRRSGRYVFVDPRQSALAGGPHQKGG